MSKKDKEKTIYQELGGDPMVARVVEVFYQKVVQDERIALFFVDVDMNRQIDKQKSFLSMIFGGPEVYTGRELKKAHMPLVMRGLDDGHVDALLEDLATALNELGVRRQLTARILVTANSFRDEVLSR